MNFDFSAVKRAFQGLESRLSSIRSEVAELQIKRDATNNAPLAKEDVKAMCSGWISATRTSFMTELSDSVERMSRSPAALANAGRARQLVALGGVADKFSGDAIEAQDLGRTICAFFGSTIQAAVEKHIDAMEWPAHAVSNARRASEVASLDERIVRLQQEEQEIINKAAEVGLHLE
jgi:hypothetical protein